MSHVTSLLLGLGNGGVYAALGNRPSYDLQEFGSGELRHRLDGLVHRCTRMRTYVTVSC